MDALKHFYPLILPLDAFLERVQATARRPEDSEALSRLFQTVHVASRTTKLPQFSPYEGGERTRMDEWIETAQAASFVRDKWSTRNILALGYKEFNCNNDMAFANPLARDQRFINFFPNTNVTFLKSNEWENLLARVGSDVMRFMLSRTSLFVSVGNGCFSQLCGQAVSNIAPLPTPTEELKSRRASEVFPERPCKRRRLNDGSAWTESGVKPSALHKTSKWRQAGAIDIPRSNMFYRRPVRSDKRGGIHIGLPPNHVLNSFLRTQEIYTPDFDPRPKSQIEMRLEEVTRHLSKHIFPRQYGLPSIFDAVQPKRKITPAVLDAHIRAGSDFSDEDGKKSTPTPSRLKPVLALLGDLVLRHSKFSYKSLCNSRCPSKISQQKRSHPERALDSADILELMSEAGTQLPPKASFGVSNRSFIVPNRPTQLGAKGIHKPRFADFIVNHYDVSRMVITMVSKVFPHAFWGCPENFKAIATHIDTFIRCRRRETLSLHDVLKDFQISACAWLGPNNAKARGQRIVRSDSLKRRQLLEEFLYWFFDSFLLSLLQTTFYITESAAYKNRLLYFRQDDWAVLCQPLVDHLCATTFRKLMLTPQGMQEEMQDRTLGYAQVRLLPKETGVRPIVNLGRQGQAAKSINRILQTAFHILTYEKDNNYCRMGATTSSHDRLYQQLKAFKTRIRCDGQGQIPKLYFVKLDVRACFDSIDQQKLLSILEDLLSEDRYMLNKYTRVNIKGSDIRRRFQQNAFPQSDHPHFIATATKLAASLRNIVFADQVTYDFATKEETLDLLREHVGENIVKIGNHYYQQTVGIPQGSVLSTLLCAFFYGDLEQRKLQIREDPNCLLLRWIDDYLFITSDKSKAQEFLRVMSEGHPEYGCFINTEKTLLNFDADLGGHMTIPAGQKGFPWIGLNIDVDDLSVSTDYSRLGGAGHHIADSLTMSTRKAGIKLRQRMLESVKLRSHVMYTDTSFNSVRSVLLNIYHNFLHSAMKMHTYWTILGSSSGLQQNFLLGLIKQSIYFGLGAIKRKHKTALAKENDARFSLCQSTVIWLGLHAFYTILSMRNNSYTLIIKSLNNLMQQRQYRNASKKYKSIVTTGSDEFFALNLRF